ncbi:hypothetical protein GCM10022211_10320 [Sphingomonas humi]|uniref:Uncharacterized protein n=1 Tax=Sphingomonas humi TaxID=335630 RepID=A0ABP7RRV5_9SPHN
MDSAGAAKGTQSVTVGAFNVGFIFESVDSGKATGGMIGAFGGTTRAKSMLVGVTPAMMQAITDAAYADFQAQLKARGFTVADHAQLFAAPDFGRVKAMAAPYEANVRLDKKSNGKATYYKPTALSKQFMLPGDIESSGMSGMGLTMAAGTNQYVVSQFAKSSGQAVIDVVYLIDFSELKRPGAFSMGGLQISSGMAVVDDYSKLKLVSPRGGVTAITVDQPISVEGDFASKQDVTKDAGLQKAANVAGGVAAAFGFGGMRFGKSKTFNFTAKPEYEAGALKAATLANARLLDQLAALR